MSSFASQLCQLPGGTASISRAAHRGFAELSADVAVILTEEGVVAYANEGTFEILGVSAQHLEGESIFAFVHEGSTANLQAALAHIDEVPSQPVALDLLSASGQRICLQTRVFRDPATRTRWLVGQRQSTGLVDYGSRPQAMLDQLTGIPTREATLADMDRQIVVAQRAGKLFAVLALGLDDFKKTNEALGHRAGDELLKNVVTRIKGVVRATDTVGRAGGDEFVLILPSLSCNADAQRVCERVMDGIRRPMKVQGHEVYMSVSVGIALYPPHGVDGGQLLQQATQAMCQAKQNGKNQAQLYEPSPRPEPASPLSLETAMHGAIDNGEFMAHFQPIVSTDGTLHGCEALLRWLRADGYFVPPSVFIPIAEKTGLITQLGDYLLRVAVQRLVMFSMAGLTNLYVSVNVSPLQLMRPNFEAKLKRVLQISGVTPCRLMLEITESSLLAGQEQIQALLRKIVATGVKLALDDFGMGNSCLGYLKSYPIHALKIDRAFVSSLTSDPVSRPILAAIVALARVLNLKTIVEGIETPVQLAALEGLGVDFVQGYLFGKPMKPEEFLNLHTACAAA